MNLLKPIPAELFLNNKEAIERGNRQMFRQVSFILLVLLTILTIFTLFSGWSFLTPTYAVFAVISAAIYSYLTFILPNHPEYPSVLFMYHCYMFLVCAMTIIMACFLEKGTPAPITAALLFVPLSITDRTFRLMILLGVVNVCYAVCAFNSTRLSPSDATFYIYNAVIFSFMAITIGNYIVRIKLEGYDDRRKLEIASRTDALTGLPNRRSLFERLAEIEKNENELTGVIMADVDIFKQYNDTLGHQAGDDCLVALGEVFSTYAQEHGVEIYRYGGEEFIVLSFAKGDVLAPLAEGLLRAVEEKNIPFPTDDFRGKVTISVGLAACRFGESCEECIRRADTALYTAKRSGRGCTQRWEEEMDANLYQPSLRTENRIEPVVSAATH